MGYAESLWNSSHHYSCSETLLTSDFHTGESRNAYDQVYNNNNDNDNDGNEHQAKFSHELVAGGAAFAGFKAFEDHQRKEGMLLRHFHCLITLVNIY